MLHFIYMHYLIGSLSLLLVWGLIYFFVKDIRREMLISSLLVTPAAFSELFFVPGYWTPDALLSPRLSIEDFIFSFAVGGIAGVSYELLMRGKIKHRRLCECFHDIKHGMSLGIGIVTILVSYYLFDLNFMYASYLGIVVDVLIIVLIRKDLIPKILLSSLVFGSFYLLFFAIFVYFLPSFILHWNVDNLSGLSLANVPLEEIWWALGTGALLGPLYEYLLGYKLSTT